MDDGGGLVSRPSMTGRQPPSDTSCRRVISAMKDRKSRRPAPDDHAVSGPQFEDKPTVALPVDPAGTVEQAPAIKTKQDRPGETIELESAASPSDSTATVDQPQGLDKTLTRDQVQETGDGSFSLAGMVPRPARTQF